jgi:hypothetical protein
MMNHQLMVSDVGHATAVLPLAGVRQTSPTFPGSSSLLILMAKSEIRTIQVWQTVENLVFQHTDGRENDFAISITFGEAVPLTCIEVRDEQTHT